MKRYLIDLLMNARDIGGYSTKEGKVTIEGRFIRSDAPQYLTESGKAEFLKMNITTVIDFRTPEISLRYPSAFKDDSRFSYFSFPIEEGSAAYAKTNEDTSLTYMKMLAHTDNFKNIFLTMINAPQGVFYNCSAGKDRTGIVTFLLLDLVGVDRDTILEDYVVSEQFINERIGLVRQDHPTFPSTMGFSKKETFNKFLALFTIEYKNGENYLLKAGLNNKQIQKIKNKILK
jgi:protein tyrosine/serine phosphatase